MAVLIDLIGSFVLGALILLNVARTDDVITARSHHESLMNMAQDNTMAVVQFMADDLRKIGYGTSGQAILQAESDRIRFLADLGNTGIVDTLSYYTSTPAQAADTPNPNDRYLYRMVNSTLPQGMRMGITAFQLHYFSASGDSLSAPVSIGAIRKIEVDMTVESTIPYDTTYARTQMQFSIRPKNLDL